MPPPGVCLNILEARQRKDGCGGPGAPQGLFHQNYHQLKESCLSRGLRFIDEMFPPHHDSIGRGLLSTQELGRVEWRRPMKLVSNPSFILDGVSRFDFQQGILGNCWFLASIGALTFQNRVFEQIVPLDQTFTDHYCGMFLFRFWMFGKWVEVIIDDKLPTINGRLIFVHSQDPHEFWPALLEKAYAKLCGSYADMRGGTPAEAMMNFTGGVHMLVHLSEPPPDLMELMFRAAQSVSLMCCGTPPGETSGETVSSNGLVQGHAYTVTGVKQMKSRGKLVNLVRLWNPWGKREWNGDWSDRSSLWNTVSADERHVCLLAREDGEFWMALEDFCRFFNDLSICCTSPNFLDGDASSTWSSTVLEGRWVSGVTAGGCMNNKETFWTNPQFRIQIQSPPSHQDGQKNTLVSLMQKPEKWNRHLVQNFHIGFSIFKVPEQYREQRGKFPASFFSSHSPEAQTKTFLNGREVMEYLELKSGDHLLVPSTFSPNRTASFVLTIHSKAETSGHDNSEDYRHQPAQKSHMDQYRSGPEDQDNKTSLFRQHSDQFSEVDAEQLQRLLHENILKGDLKSGGFSLDACRSMVALMDTSITGKLNKHEFIRLWNKVQKYKDIFFLTDVSKTGTLSLGELRNAFAANGTCVSDHILNLMALRYSASSGHITLESFISLVLRLDCMHKIFQKLSDGNSMTLRESEWIYVSMYT